MTQEQDAQSFYLWLADLQEVTNQPVTISAPAEWTLLDRAALSNAAIAILKTAWYLTESAQKCFDLAQADDPWIVIGFESAKGELLGLIDGLGGIDHDNRPNNPKR